MPLEMPKMPKIGRAAARTSAIPTLTPEEEESLARRAGRTALGGLSAVGNLFDLPGSMVRDIATGNNPLDQLLSPFSHDNRVTGRDIGRKMGAMSKKDTWGNLAGGIGIEIAMDPLTYIFPFGAATKAGNLVKAAGLSSKARIVGAGAKGVEQVGRRQAGVQATLRHIWDAAEPAERTALETAAKASKVDLPQVMDQPLRGMFGLGVLGKPMKVMGTGPKAQRYAAALDRAGRRVRYGKVPGTDFSPMDSVARLLNPRLAGVAGEKAQVYAKAAFEGREKARQAANLEIAQYTTQLEKLGWGTPEEGDKLRRFFEQKQHVGTEWDNAPPEIKALVERAEKYKDSVRQAVLAEGGKMDEYVSPIAKHWPRQGLRDEAIPSGTMTGKGFDAATQSAEGRIAILRPFVDKQGVAHGIQGETETIRKMIADEEIGRMVDGKDINGANVAPSTPEEIAAKIQEKYGDLIPEKFNELTKTGKMTEKNRYRALANWIANMEPAHRKAGFFANNPVNDLQSYAVNGFGAAASLRQAREFLMSPGTIREPIAAARKTGTKTLRQAIEGIQGKVDSEEFAKVMAKEKMQSLSAKDPAALQEWLSELADDLGKDLSELDEADLAQYMLKHTVDERDADSLRRMVLGFNTPQPAEGIVKAFDSGSNFWKAMQTAIWPGFHVRNFLSGQVQNWMDGTWSLQSANDAWNLLHGKTIKGAADIPWIKQLAARRGLQQLDDEAATQLLGEIAYATGATSRSSGEAVARAGDDAFTAAQKLSDISREVPRPGYASGSLRRAGRKAMGVGPDANWNPTNVRGFGGRTESTFAPMAGGEDVSHLVEGMNRIAPLIQQLRKGIDPAAAMERIGRAQVRYESRFFTPFERQVLKRIFPFYSFSSRVPIWMARELAERPGGKLAQVIRGFNTAKDPSAMTPDYVAETTSVPLGRDKDGTERYLTGAGLMFEDPLAFLGGGARGTLLEGLSRTNPFVKAPLEWATNQSFFQKGPIGGRSLDDLDPTIGRLLANLSGKKEPVTWPGSKTAEFAAGQFVGRPITTARTASYPVRDPSIPEAIKTALNLGTGVRVTSVRPGAQDAMFRERANEMMKKLGSKQFLRTYIPESVEARMSPKELEDARKLEALLNLLASRAKKRAEEEKAKKK